MLTDGDPDALAITDRQLPGVTAESGTELALPADPHAAASCVASPGAGEVLAAVDVVFPVLHGPYGEDGTMQGLLELAGLPYVGPACWPAPPGWTRNSPRSCLSPRAFRSAPRGAAARDGTLSRGARATGSAGIRQTRPRWLVDRCHPGRDWDELPAAVADARRHDPKVIVEAAINGREIECGVLEMPDGPVEASTLGEIRVAGVRGREDAFYDFATKYLDDAAEFDVPAKVDDDIAHTVRQLAIRAFRAIDCQGLARVDFFLTEDGPVINEVNTMPGFTTISMYPRMWAASGIDYAALLATMVETALARGMGLR